MVATQTQTDHLKVTIMQKASTGAMLLVSAVAGFMAFQIACKGTSVPTNAQLEKGAVDFCKARADYKILAAASGGALDPLPGTPRAVLEANEDIFCSSVKGTLDAGK